jgi:transposase
LRKVWAKRGQRPVVTTIPRYEWLYLYGFVCPQTGQTYWLIMPSVNITIFNLALAEFAKSVGAGKDKRIVLVLDGAGWHTSEKVQIPEGLEFIFLPPYSPELQPAERLWSLTNEAIANRAFDTLDQLQAAQEKRCLALAEQSPLIKALTCFKWWPVLAF